MANCPNCNSTGKIEGPPGTLRISAYTKRCPSCKGSGKVTAEVARWWVICKECNGWGEVGMQIAPQTCPICKGVGIISRSRRRATE